jgi:hypothetical protein
LRYVPKPAAHVGHRFQHLAHAYDSARPGRLPVDALCAALPLVFFGDELQEVCAFMAGELDGVYGAGEGFEFLTMTLDHLERGYVRQAPLVAAMTGRGHTTPKPKTLVELAEWLATDTSLTYGYRAALDAQDGAFIGILLGGVENDIVRAASGALTKTGRKIKIEQAAKVFQLLGYKARKVPRDLNAANQATWCAAVAAILKPHYR